MATLNSIKLTDNSQTLQLVILLKGLRKHTRGRDSKCLQQAFPWESGRAIPSSLKCHASAYFINHGSEQDRSTKQS